MSDWLRSAEESSIREFVQMAADAGFLCGRVLDYGCGQQPYRNIVEAAGGDYRGYDRASYPASVSEKDHGPSGVLSHFQWDSILCTQVVQYLPLSGTVQFDDRPSPTIIRPLEDTLRRFYTQLWKQGGRLVLTYPTHWPEVEPSDLHRFTKSGMERLLTEAGFSIIEHVERHAFQHQGIWFIAGYGVIARA